MDGELTDLELRAITGRRTLRQQVAALVRMGVPFRFGGGRVVGQGAVAQELPQYQAVQPSYRPRLDMVR